MSGGYVMCTIIEVDAFKAYSYFNAQQCTPKHQQFVEKQATALLTNKYEGVCRTEHRRS